MIDNFIKNFHLTFGNHSNEMPWIVTENLSKTIKDLISKLNSDYKIENEIAIHKTAIVENPSTLKGPIIISENCFIASFTYLRGPIFIGKSVTIGPGSEIKQSIIGNNSNTAHFNFIGNSVIGSNVNFEAGAVIANHYNERVNKEIFVLIQNKMINTQVVKFGAIVGDGCKIGENAVLSPGTILERNTVVDRMQVINQTKDIEL